MLDVAVEVVGPRRFARCFLSPASPATGSAGFFSSFPFPRSRDPSRLVHLAPSSISILQFMTNRAESNHQEEASESALVARTQIVEEEEEEDDDDDEKEPDGFGSRLEAEAESLGEGREEEVLHKRKKKKKKKKDREKLKQLLLVPVRKFEKLFVEKKQKRRKARPSVPFPYAYDDPAAGKGCFVCCARPPPIPDELPFGVNPEAAAKPSVPSYHSFLKTLLETNDFYSKECNVHCDIRRQNRPEDED